MEETFSGAPDRASRAGVLVVSTNPETLDGLQSYLRGAGFAARCTRDLAQCTRIAREEALAVVLFPDDFDWEAVVAALADLSARGSPALPVVVTARPQSFASLKGAEELIVMPRPVWGWTILDALKAELARARDGAVRALEPAVERP